MRLSRWITLPVRLFWITNLFMLIIVTFKPADALMPLYRKIWYNYPNPTKLFFEEDNPYHRAYEINYYHRKNLEIKKMDSASAILKNARGNFLFATRHPGSVKIFPGSPVLVYSSLPQWVKHFNINHWVERTDFWSVYEINPYPSPNPIPAGREGAKGKGM